MSRLSELNSKLPHSNNKETISYNYRAISKVIVILIVIGASFYLNHPGMGYMGEWIHDAEWYQVNNTTVGGYHVWVNLSTPAKISFLLFPGIFVVPMLLWYGFVTRLHRKKLILNGYPEGVVMWTYGIEPHNSHLYDLCSALRGFKQIPWEEIHLPISLGFYKGLKVIYYKISSTEHPLEWHRMVIENENQIRVTPYNIYVEGKYVDLVKHPDNLILSYIRVGNNNEYLREEPDMDTIKIYHRDTITRIQRDNIEVLQSNPDIAGGMITASMFVVPTGTKQDFMDLMTQKEREDYIRSVPKE